MNNILQQSINIAIVRKNISNEENYSFVEKALNQAANQSNKKIVIHWIDSKEVTKDNVSDKLKGFDAILVPGGFGYDGVEGMINAIEYARTNKVPFFGICLGMQLTVIEFARNVANLKDATSSEFDKQSSCKVIDRLPNLINDELREGILPCVLKADSLIERCYQSLDIEEAFRHGYTFNDQYSSLLEEKGLVLSALSKNGQYIEAVEINDHPFYLGVQFHPELSHPDKSHPLFLGFIEVAFNNRKGK